MRPADPAIEPLKAIREQPRNGLTGLLPCELSSAHNDLRVALIGIRKNPATPTGLART